MQNIFIISDVWFNRILESEKNMDITTKNDTIIQKWNSVVSVDDKVYVLGGFGITDTYPILIKLNGEIHFLNNYLNDDEKRFMSDLKFAVTNSTEHFLKNRIVFEEEQIISIPEYDSILSYYPLSDWSGRDCGTFCFHGFNDFMDIKGNNVTCLSKYWNDEPVNLLKLQNNFKSFKEKI